MKVEKIGEKCSSCGDRWAKLQPDLELKTCTQCGKMCWRPNMYDLCISCFCEHVLSQYARRKRNEHVKQCVWDRALGHTAWFPKHRSVEARA